MRYVAIAGTHDVDGRHEDTSAWWHPASPFAGYLASHGWTPALREPYVWSGDVDGDVWRPWAPRFATWHAAADDPQTPAQDMERVEREIAVLKALLGRL